MEGFKHDDSCIESPLGMQRYKLFKAAVWSENIQCLRKNFPNRHEIDQYLQHEGYLLFNQIIRDNRLSVIHVLEDIGADITECLADCRWEVSEPAIFHKRHATVKCLLGYCQLPYKRRSAYIVEENRMRAVLAGNCKMCIRRLFKQPLIDLLPRRMPSIVQLEIYCYIHCPYSLKHRPKFIAELYKSLL